MQWIWLLPIVPAITLMAEPSASLLQAGHLPSLTVTTRTTTDHVGTISTQILYVKGQRRRFDWIFAQPDGIPTTRAQTTLTQCDLHREVVLFAEDRTFAIEPFMDESARARAAAASPRATDGPRVTVTIETTDTGERRPIGTLVARHVVTTRTTAPSAGASTPRSVAITDGWYIDASHSCDQSVGIGLLTFSGRADGRMDQLVVVQRGAPEVGYAIEKTETSDSLPDYATRTTLVALSEDVLDDGVFEIPAGYRPALPLPGGGVDPARVDSVANRAIAHVQWIASWIMRLFE